MTHESTPERERSLVSDGAMHVVTGEGTRKGRYLEADGRCAIATTSTMLPSLDVVIDGVAEPVRDEDTVRQIAEFLNSNRRASSAARSAWESRILRP